MVFSSIVFLLYFLPVFLLAYYFADIKYKNIVILFFSIIFYSWGAPKFIFAVLGTTFIDFHIVHWMSDSKNIYKKRLLLVLSVSMNLGLLFYFKYSNFFIENVNSLLDSISHKHIYFTRVIMPIGISFFIFETITYVVDVYKGLHKPLKNFWDYQLYIILFPKLIAGPIIRYHQLADQITDRTRNETIDNKLTGFYRFCIGLAKKVLIANFMGQQADLIFKMNYADLGTGTAWVGILCYTFQIYFDFSGYSDMAIGLGKMIGFKFPENFNNPYTSIGITDFWRRWHISLGSWMRNYLYIPLGGNRVLNNRRLYLNLSLVFLASGLWHGASWSFVVWGAYHGLFIILDRLFLIKVYAKLGRIMSILITFIIVVIGWVFFRVDKLSDAFTYLRRMFSFDFTGTLHYDIQFYTIITLALFFSFFTSIKIGQKIQDAVYFNLYDSKRHLAVLVISVALLIVSISSITASGFNPFIYFRF